MARKLFHDKHRLHDPVWHVQAAMLVAIILQVALPDIFSIGRYILPIIEFALLLVLPLTTPKAKTFQSSPARRLNVFLLIGLVSIANAYSLGVIINKLLTDNSLSDGRSLIFAAINIFMTNIIIFALWYWEMDGGGPGERQRIEKYEQDFLFPQHKNADYRHPDWKPTFVDYLYTSATNAMNFAPADGTPITRRGKMLMLTQSSISLVTGALVISRAIGILN
jgi:uncharacterized membrane protein